MSPQALLPSGLAIKARIHFDTGFYYLYSSVVLYLKYNGQPIQLNVYPNAIHEKIISSPAVM